MFDIYMLYMRYMLHILYMFYLFYMLYINVFFVFYMFNIYMFYMLYVDVFNLLDMYMFYMLNIYMLYLFYMYMFYMLNIYMLYLYYMYMFYMLNIYMLYMYWFFVLHVYLFYMLNIYMLYMYWFYVLSMPLVYMFYLNFLFMVDIQFLYILQRRMTAMLLKLLFLNIFKKNIIYHFLNITLHKMTPFFLLMSPVNFMFTNFKRDICHSPRGRLHPHLISGTLRNIQLRMTTLQFPTRNRFSLSNRTFRFFLFLNPLLNFPVKQIFQIVHFILHLIQIIFHFLLSHLTGRFSGMFANIKRDLHHHLGFTLLFDGMMVMSIFHLFDEDLFVWVGAVRFQGYSFIRFDTKLFGGVFMDRFDFLCCQLRMIFMMHFFCRLFRVMILDLTIWTSLSLLDQQ